jgi:hypothetical protein
MNRKRVVTKSPAQLERLLALDRPPKAPAVTLSVARYRGARIEALELDKAPAAQPSPDARPMDNRLGQLKLRVVDED